MLVLVVGTSLFFFVMGFVLATFTEGSSRGALEHNLFLMEIENERLKRSAK